MSELFLNAKFCHSLFFCNGTGRRELQIAICKGGFPLGEMNGDFAGKFIWACAFLFVYGLAGKIFLFKIVKTDLTNSRRKNSPQLLDLSKQKYISIFALSVNTFQSDQVEDGC